MEISVYDFVQLCCDPSMLKVAIFDLAVGEELYRGYADEIPEEYEDMKVWSYDAPVSMDYGGTDTLEINVDTGSEV